MNVTKTAYYSTDYLKNKHEHSPPNRTRDKKLPRSAMNHGNASGRYQNDLTEEMTPAELHNLTKEDWKNSQYRAAYHELAANNGVSSRGTMSHQSFMDSYYSPQMHELYEPSLPKKYEGYYIDQKRKQDEARAFRPASYTHKTFQRIFGDDEQPRLNPIDVVFQDKEDLELTQKAAAPPKRLYKNVQRKLAGDDYVNYDYFKEQQKEQRSESKKGVDALNNPTGYSELHNIANSAEEKPKKRFFPRLKKKQVEKTEDVFTDQPDIDNDSTDEELEAWMAQQPGQDTSGNPTLQRQIKRKWRKAKRTIGDKYFENYKRELKSRQAQTEKVAAPPKPDSVSAEFNPIWSNILSWVVYKPNDPSENKIEDISDQVSVAGNEDTKSNFKQRFLQTWSRPASMMKTDDWRCRELVKSSELDMSEQPEGEIQLMVAHEAETGALPPQALATPGQSAPIQVVSHINQLIKSVRIMKIIFSPIDIIGQKVPSLQSTVIVLELFIFVWILYEVSLLIDALCLAVRAVCAPMIAIGRFMNRVV